MALQTVRFHMTDFNSEDANDDQWRFWLTNMIIYAGYMPFIQTFLSVNTDEDRYVEMEFVSDCDTNIINFRLDSANEEIRKDIYIFKSDS